jgi:hypothetical protein
MRKTVILFIILAIGCTANRKAASIDPVAEKNKDVLLLSVLISDHLKRTDGRTFTIDELLQDDSLKRIAGNFEKTELKAHGGYISVYYKFSKSRDLGKIELTDKEKEMLLWSKWTEKKSSGEYDGEIQFAYGERFYHIKKLIVKK